MRHNRDGVLYVPWGYVSSAQVDPIEKKPLAHFLPGTNVLTFGMLGCNFHCSFCQNWITTQTLRDNRATIPIEYLQAVTPQQLVDYAKRSGAESIASSYNEPLITTEWAVDIFRLAKSEGLRCVYVSNGYATTEVLTYLRPYLDAFKIDLKTMQEKNYRELGGRLNHVLDAIKMAFNIGLWVEVVTLVIPGYNDSPDELWEASRYIASVSPDIPWHVSAFHPDYKMADRSPTSAQTLLKAAEIGQEAGLHYVYAGNLPGKVGSLEDTHCPACHTLLIKRRGYTVQAYHLTADGMCTNCGASIAGIWTDKPESVNLHQGGMPFRLRW